MFSWLNFYDCVTWKIQMNRDGKTSIGMYAEKKVRNCHYDRSKWHKTMPMLQSFIFGHEKPGRKGKDFSITHWQYDGYNKAYTCLCRGFSERIKTKQLCGKIMQIFPLTDNTLSILAKHSGFSRQKQEVYLLPIIISDSGNPPMSSTSTLTIRVCGCSSDGIVQSCNVEAYVLPIGLSMGALIAILACIILLLGTYWFHSPVFKIFLIHRWL